MKTKITFTNYWVSNFSSQGHELLQDLPEFIKVFHKKMASFNDDSLLIEIGHSSVN
jgi:hypothetical protein